MHDGPGIITIAVIMNSGTDHPGKPAASPETRLEQVRQRIRDAEHRYERVPGSVRLLAVSKHVPASVLQQAMAGGQHCFGESYVQEALEKIALLDRTPPEWHFIGPVQSNKTRDIAEHFDWVHSVDRLKIARRLSEQRPPALPPLNVCLQINISGEQSKSGLSPGEVRKLADDIADLPRLRLRGLMALPARSRDFDAQFNVFCSVRDIFNDIVQHHPDMDTLSMGMSGDLEAAIAAGSTLIRIGTAIFGERGPR